MFGFTIRPYAETESLFGFNARRLCHLMAPITLVCQKSLFFFLREWKKVRHLFSLVFLSHVHTQMAHEKMWCFSSFTSFFFFHLTTNSSVKNEHGCSLLFRLMWRKKRDCGCIWNSVTVKSCSMCFCLHFDGNFSYANKPTTIRKDRNEASFYGCALTICYVFFSDA